MEFTVQSFEDLERVASYILENAKYKIFTLSGNLGAGKTSLVKYLGKNLGSDDEISSPTYSIVNEYHYPSGKIYHFDLYRINDFEELINIGFHEYIDSGNYCFIEWPEISVSELPEHHEILLNLKDQTRYITFK